LIFKDQYSSTEQKKRKHHKKKRKVVVEDNEQNTETTIAINDKETNDSSQKVTKKKVKIKSNRPQKLDELYSNLDTDDRKQETIVIGDVDNRIHDSSSKTSQAAEAAATEHNLINIDSINDIKTGAGPVVGYADEPLLPLVKACAPLINIIHDLSTYVQLSLNETPEQPSDGLTIDESAAIRLYTMEWEGPHRSLYSMLNHTLKTGTREELHPYFKYLKLFLTALIKLPCVESLTVWRGVTKNLSAEFPPGTPVTWWSFSSCTTSLTVLENNMYLGNTGERTLFSVEAINGRTIRNHSHFVTEDEILLLPGTHMIVQSQFSPAPELHIIHLKQIIPEETLLEPPFEGIILNYFLYIEIYLYLGAQLYPKIK
jgi:hypothetical protein